MFRFIRCMICKLHGHNFEIYEHRYGIHSTDIEMAGHCKRCGYDTHEEAEK